LNFREPLVTETSLSISIHFTLNSGNITQHALCACVSGDFGFVANFRGIRIFHQKSTPQKGTHAQEFIAVSRE
jgi:hypothetical protein